TRLRVVARRAERHTLVERHNVAELRVVEERVEDRALRGAGVAEDQPHAVGDQALHEDVLASHAQDLLPGDSSTKVERALGGDRRPRTTMLDSRPGWTITADRPDSSRDEESTPHDR